MWRPRFVASYFVAPIREATSCAEGEGERTRAVGAVQGFRASEIGHPVQGFGGHEVSAGLEGS